MNISILWNMGYYSKNGIYHSDPPKCNLKDSSSKGSWNAGDPPTGQGSKCNICFGGHTTF